MFENLAQTLVAVDYRGEQSVLSRARYCVGGPAATESRTSTEAKTSSQDLNSHGCLPVNTRSSFLRITTLIDGLFQKNRVLAQDGVESQPCSAKYPRLCADSMGV